MSPSSVLLALALAWFGLADPACRQAPERPDAAGRAAAEAPRPDERTRPPYDFARPALSHALPGRLEEISGIALVDDRHVAAIEDNDGNLYLIDFRTGEIVDERPFEGKGDYEDVERVGDRLYVLKSDGDLFEIEDWQQQEPDEVHRRQTDVPKGCDAEGLALHPDRNRLLIACKERAGKRLDGFRTIFAYDLDEEELEKDPVIVLSLAELEAFMQASARGDEGETKLDYEHDAESFKPSAIRFHPVTGELYVLSSVTKAVAVLSPEGRIREVYPLSGRLLPQPEGLAFLPNGDLLISSEGRGEKGSLHLFTHDDASRPGS